jgi:hypothetical protein
MDECIRNGFVEGSAFAYSNGDLMVVVQGRLGR